MERGVMDEFTNHSGTASSKHTAAPDDDGPAILTATPGASDGKSWHGESLGKIGDALSELGEQAVDHLTSRVRDKPIVTVALTSVIFLAVGVLLGRR
jgi:hypothetical protein